MAVISANRVKKRLPSEQKLENSLTPLLVVAAAIRRNDGKILLHRRPAGKENAGLWEFPGGKVEAHERTEEALAREIREECGLIIRPESFVPVSFAVESRETGDLVLLLFHCVAPAGEPRSLEGGLWQWQDLSGAENLVLAPLDRRLRKDLIGWAGGNTL